MEYVFYVSLFPLIISAILTLFHPDKSYARNALLMGLTGAVLLEGAGVAFYTAFTSEYTLLAQHPLSIVAMVSFFLITLFTPAWSTKAETFVGLSFLIIIAFLMILSNEIMILFSFIAISWALLIFMVRKHAGVMRLCIIYAALIFSCFALGTSFKPAMLLGYILLLGIFPLSAWYGYMFANVSTGISASMMVIQCIAATKIALFIPNVAENSHSILLCLALLSSLMAAFQPIALRALSALAASQLAFIAFCFLLPYEGLNEARSIIAATFMLASPGLVLAIGALEARRGALTLYRPQGNYESYPRLANVILFFGLLSAGFPLSLGYVGEDLLFEMDFHHEPLIIISGLFIIAINSITVIKLFLYLCQGKAKVEHGIDLKRPKYIAACLSIAILFFSAFFIH